MTNFDRVSVASSSARVGRCEISTVLFLSYRRADSPDTVMARAEAPLMNVRRAIMDFLPVCLKREASTSEPAAWTQVYSESHSGCIGPPGTGADRPQFHGMRSVMFGL